MGVAISRRSSSPGGNAGFTDHVIAIAATIAAITPAAEISLLATERCGVIVPDGKVERLAEDDRHGRVGINVALLDEQHDAVSLRAGDVESARAARIDSAARRVEQRHAHSLGQRRPRVDASTAELQREAGD